jgi:hypothetical protein
MHTRLSKETEANPDARICYLMVSHGVTIDCMSTSFTRFESNPEQRPDFKTGFSDDQRKIVLSDFEKDKYQYGNPNFCSISGFQTN